DLPNGIELLRGERIQGCSALKFDDEFTAEWLVRATRPMHAMVQLHVSADGVETVTYPATLTFAKSLNLPRASYVPKPKPVRGPFEVGVKYYPGWKGASRWGRIMPYPERMPLLGWYREGDPEVADWQIKWAVEHGITFFFYDWYWVRGYRHHEHALHDGLLRARYRNYIKFAIFWANHNPPKTSSEDDLLNVVDFWLRNYFRHENYLKVDGKPVVGIFTPRRFTDDMGSDAVRRAFARMRERVREAGFEGLYIIARAHGLPDELKRLEHEGYDAIWSTPHLRMGVPPYVNSAPIKMVYDLHAKHWHEVIAHRILQFVPMVWSGWDSRPWHRQRAFILRGSSPEIFKVQLERARQVLEGLTGQPRMCIIWAWNEWGEGSFIEPHRHFGFGYLDAIREVFTDAPKEHVDIVPEDVGLGPYDTPSARVQIAWEFNRNGDHEGWDASMHMRDLCVQDGCLHAVTVGNDPAFFGPPTRARASRYKFVIIRMRTTRDDIAQLYWITRFIPESEATCYRFKVIGDGRFHEYKLPVHEVRTWRGTITRLRLDPANCPNVRVSVDYIRLAER
ncbi:MAG TPA: hypothetical protein EYP10_00960, partial [Armatimonadetes bacterium]|nr:hypothetical protein [Armatimonadota bacterium]